MSKEAVSDLRAFFGGGSKPATSPDLDEAFGGGSGGGATVTMAELAEQIVREEAEIQSLEKSITQRKADLDKLRWDLCEALEEAGIEMVTLANGLKPKRKVYDKYFASIDEHLFGWLNAKGLGDIVVPYVHWSTLQSALKTFIDQGNKIDTDVISAQQVKTVTMYGKKAFLNS